MYGCAYRTSQLVRPFFLGFLFFFWYMHVPCKLTVRPNARASPGFDKKNILAGICVIHLPSVRPTAWAASECYNGRFRVSGWTKAGEWGKQSTESFAILRIPISCLPPEKPLCMCLLFTKNCYSQTNPRPHSCFFVGWVLLLKWNMAGAL